MQPFGAVHRLDHTVQPVQIPLGLGDRAQRHQCRRGHRGVADPAVAVIPVADAADLLGQRRGGRRHDRAGVGVHKPAQRQRRPLHQLRFQRRQRQRGDPVAPVALRAFAPGVVVHRALRQILGAAAQLEHTRPVGRVDDGPRGLVDPVGHDLPLHAGRPQHHRVVGREHPQTALVDTQMNRRLRELGPRRELDHRLGLPADDTDQIGAARADVVRQVVGDQQAGPTGFDGHRAGDVALAQRQRLALRTDREVACGGVAEQPGEHGRRIGLRMAHPDHVGVGCQQRHGAGVGQHRQPLDRRAVPARAARCGAPRADIPARRPPLRATRCDSRPGFRRRRP